jgi:hypothetical protein
MDFEQTKQMGDAVSILVVLLAWLNVFSIVMTILASIAALAWSCLRIYETDTVQKFLRRRRERAR